MLEWFVAALKPVTLANGAMPVALMWGMGRSEEALVNGVALLLFIPKNKPDVVALPKNKPDVVALPCAGPDVVALTWVGAVVLWTPTVLV